MLRPLPPTVAALRWSHGPRWCAGLGRELLDRWQLYHQRCLLDICITPYSNAKIPAQTYSVCQFCGENLTHSSGRKESRGGMGQAGGRAGYRGVAQAGLRLSTCPNCVKPLPRCAVCLQTMDAANPAAVDPARRTKLLLEPAALGQQQPNVDAAANSFDRWYAQGLIRFSSCLVQTKTAGIEADGECAGSRGASAATTAGTRAACARGLTCTRSAPSLAASACATRRMSW